MTPPKLLELFAGIGGASAAWPEAQCVAAYDINELAREVFEANFSVPYRVRSLESVRLEEYCELQADCWWMSPPCQPHSRKGQRRDAQDHRSAALNHIVKSLGQIEKPEVLPGHIVLENVVGFESSQAAARLLETLQAQGYQTKFLKVCPSQFGWLNRRPRIYLLASREALQWPAIPEYSFTHETFLESDLATGVAGILQVDAGVLARFETALDRIDPQSAKPTSCFTASYGKAILRSGSYLLNAESVRRFTPREVARYLGFPDSFQLPGEFGSGGDRGFSCRSGWKLLGNSLSLPAARFALEHLSIGPKFGEHQFGVSSALPAVEEKQSSRSR